MTGAARRETRHSTRLRGRRPGPPLAKASSQDIKEIDDLLRPVRRRARFGKEDRITSFNRSVLAAVVMMVGSFGALGCKHADAQIAARDDAPAADAPAANDDTTQVVTAPGVEQDANGVRYAVPAPPALRVEVPGAAPSPHHTWQRGYWRWDTARTLYVWAPGYWEDTTAYALYAPPALRYENPGLAPSADYYYVPGFWRWGGREYVWAGGHWAGRRDGCTWYRPSYAFENGRWANHPARWDYRSWDCHGDAYRRGEWGHHGDGRGDAGRRSGPRQVEPGRRGGAPRAEAPHRAVPRGSAPATHTGPVRRGHG